MSKRPHPEFGMSWFGSSDRPLLDYNNPEEFFDEEAQAHACPTRNEVKQVYGTEWALERYASCNIVMEKLVLESAAELNPALLQSLITPTNRLPDEPVGEYEADAVPKNYATVMNLGSMSYGYSIPRVMLEVMGRDAKGRLDINHDILPNLVDGIEQAIRESQTPYTLLAKLADFAFSRGVTTDKLLSHIFAQGMIKEQNCVSQYKEIEAALEQFAPAIWARYVQMSDEAKRANDMWVGDSVER